MLQIPLINIPSQMLSLVLNYQDITITVYTKTDDVYGDNMYIDVIKDGVPLVLGELIVINQPLVPSYKEFNGNLYMVDLDGADDPHFEGLGTRWVLVYAEDSEL